jgi:bifunctional DNase/RNase
MRKAPPDPTTAAGASSRLSTVIAGRTQRRDRDSSHFTHPGARVQLRQNVFRQQPWQWKRGKVMAIRVFVDSVRINQTANTRVVLLKDSKIERYLLIHIGEWESYAIAAELQGHRSARPLTHDLLRSMLEQLDVHVASVIVHSIRDEVFFASIILEHGEKKLEIDARPSDAIALAVRVDAPIYVSETVFEQAGLRVANKDPEEEEKLAVFRDFVNQLDF